MSSYFDLSLAKIEQFEGSIPWMYRDTVGKVTAGVGLMLPNPAAAQLLPFQVAGRPASQAEIAADFARVDALPMGRPALFYRAAGNPELVADEISTLLGNVLRGFEGELRAALPSYDSLPDTVKMALLDMAYNLGPGGLLHGYPRLMQAVRAGKWAQAAANCERIGPGAARNEWTREMFLNNVVGTVKAQSESTAKSIAFGVIGASAALWEKIRKPKRP